MDMRFHTGVELRRVMYSGREEVLRQAGRQAGGQWNSRVRCKPSKTCMAYGEKSVFKSVSLLLSGSQATFSQFILSKPWQTQSTVLAELTHFDLVEHCRAAHPLIVHYN